MRRTRTGGVWVGLVSVAIALILLLIFILQNSHNVTIRFFGFHGQLSLRARCCCPRCVAFCSSRYPAPAGYRAIAPRRQETPQPERHS